MWGYSNPGVRGATKACFKILLVKIILQVRRQLMERSSQRGERPLDQVVESDQSYQNLSVNHLYKADCYCQDVDSAFNFLETYSTKAEEDPEEAAVDGSYSSYLAEQSATGIPR